MDSTNSRNYGSIINNTVVALVIFSYFDLFQLTFIPYMVRQASSILMCLVMLVFIILRLIYQPDHRVKMNFSTPIIILILSTIPSYFIAQIYHKQTLFISVLANRTIWFYLLYYYIHLYKISVKFIIKLIITVGLIAVALYYIQYALYPRKIVDVSIFSDRGTLRIFVPGMIFTTATYFYFLNKFFEKNNLFALLIALICFSIYILQGTRINVFPILMLSVFYFLFTKRIKARFVLFIFMSIGVFTVFLTFRQIFLEMTKLSSSQAQNVGGNVRYKAATFFLTDFMPGIPAYIFGNSASEVGSLYYQKLNYYTIKYGFYITDIGIIGDYVKYGIIFIIAGLVFLFKPLKFKISSKYACFKYYIAAQCFTLLTGYGILGGVDVTIILILYIFDMDRDNYLKFLNENESKTSEIIPLKT